MLGSPRAIGRFPGGRYDATAGAGSFTLPVKGASASADVRVALELLGGQWLVVEAEYRTGSGSGAWLLEKNTGPRRRAQTHLVRGHNAYKNGDSRTAWDEFEQALALWPENASIHYWRGRLHLQDGRPSEAAAEFEQAVVLDPAHADAHDNLGYIYGREGDYPRSIAHFTHAIELKPADGMLYYSRSISHARNGDHERARNDTRQACRHGYQDGCRDEKRLREVP